MPNLTQEMIARRMSRAAEMQAHENRPLHLAPAAGAALTAGQKAAATRRANEAARNEERRAGIADAIKRTQAREALEVAPKTTGDQAHPFTVAAFELTLKEWAEARDNPEHANHKRDDFRGDCLACQTERRLLLMAARI